MKPLLSVAVLVYIVIAASGCSVTIGDDGNADSTEGSAASTSAKAELEATIEEQLPAQQEAALGQPIYVTDVGCTRADANRFECFATMNLSSRAGQLLSQPVAITAVCDADSCTWRTVP